MSGVPSGSNTEVPPGRFCVFLVRFFPSPGIRDPFWRRSGWWRWRQQEVKAMNRSRAFRRHLFPRFTTETVSFVDAAEAEAKRFKEIVAETGRYPGQTVNFFVPKVEGAKLDPFAALPSRQKRLKLRRKAVREAEEAEKAREDADFVWRGKGGGRVWEERKANIPLGKKKLLLYCTIIKGLQITDAIDWLSSLCLHRVNYLLNLLNASRKKIHEQGGDISRVYVESYMLNIQGQIKRPQFRLRMVNLIKTWKFAVVLRFREYPMDEYFHKLFILKHVPRSLTTDMRLALAGQRVGLHAVRDWYPFLDSKTRFFHRKVLAKQKKRGGRGNSEHGRNEERIAKPLDRKRTSPRRTTQAHSPCRPTQRSQS
ncbi:ribosomal protein L22p/L17e [Toxoplasma gondii TgCatPRC2]|uniref:Ribosomal protein L22p/L17e n=1 Tax=Toxoplasma gondii TgCatPRC2 TaxID=1130821 RepID=A0A151HMP6_TOXGO|nr:ribosomal protein L22p/L17e [Toxoplasma gondii TgCatPRC2]